MRPLALSSPSPESASRPTSGRQTLGSNHDAPQPPLASPPDAADLQWFRGGELWPVWWDVFKDRCAELGSGEAAKTAGRLIQHVETGWGAIRELQLACERQRGHAVSEGDRLSHFLAYLESDVVTAFVACTEAVTGCLRPAKLSGGGDGSSACGLAARFDRGLAVAALAAQASELSPSFRTAVNAVADALVDWGAEVCTLLSAFIRITVDPAG